MILFKQLQNGKYIIERYILDNKFIKLKILNNSLCQNKKG